MREMVGGCCVCSDERGWTENPLVYCDGHGCAVAVHQACYGIVAVPTGPWFCRKCESQERAARVRCELCPQREGALKRTDTGGWCHVVCALFIPEAWFGNVQTMEPIILKGVPPERFNKSCYVCEEHGREGKATSGACMQCNKNGCKQHFHVTCAQGQGQLCEEAGSYMDNVKYCGYCSYHYKKLKKDSHIKTIPAFKPIAPENLTPDGTPEKRGDKPRLRHGPGLSLGSSLSRDKGGGMHRLMVSASQATVSTAPSSGSGSTPSSPEPTLSSIAAAYQREREQKEREKAQAADAAVDKEPPADIGDSGDSNPSSAKSITDITSTGKFTTANFTETTITPSPATFDFGSPSSDNGKPEEKPPSEVKEKVKEKEKSSKSKKAEKREKANDSGLSSSVGSDSGETDKSSTQGSASAVPVNIKRGSPTVSTGSAKSSTPSGSASATPKPPTTASSSTPSSSSKNTPSIATATTSSSSKSTSSFSYSYENFLNSNYSSSNLPPPPVEKVEKESERSTTPLSSPPELEPAPCKRQRSRSGEKSEKKKSKKVKQEKIPKAKTVKDLLATKDSPTWGPGSPPASPTRPTPPTTTSGKKGNKKKCKDPTSPLSGSLSPTFVSPYSQNSGGTTAVSISSLQRGDRDNPTENAASASSFFPDNMSNTSTGQSHEGEMNGPSLVGPPKPGSVKSALLSPTRASVALGGGDNHGTNQLPTSMEQLLERQWDQGSQFLMEQGQHFDIASLLNCLHQLRQENQRLEEHIATLTARRDQLLAVNARLSLPLTPLNNPHAGAGASHPGASGGTPPEGGGGHHRSPRINNLLPQDAPSSAAQDTAPSFNRSSTRSPAHGQSPAQNHLPQATTQSPGSQTANHNSHHTSPEGRTSGPPTATPAPGMLPASSQAGNATITEQQRLHQLLLNAQLTQEQYQQLVYQSLQHHSVAAAGLQPPGTPTSHGSNTQQPPQQRGAPSSGPHNTHRGPQGAGFTPQRSTSAKTTSGDKSKEKT